MDSITVRIGEEEVTVQLNPKVFKTQSTGFNGSGKISVGDKKYQISCNIILIGSRPKSASETKRK
jgi:hypothetical protein